MMLNGRCPGHATGLSRQTSAQINHVQGLRHGHTTSRVSRGSVARVATRETQAAVPDLADATSNGLTEHAAAASGGCPFLAALPAPPPAQHKWWTRLLQLRDPPVFQAAALGPHKVVQTGSELGLPAQIVIGDGDLARLVLAGEGDITQQGNFLKGFSKIVGPESLLTVQDPRHKYLRALIMPAFEKPAIERLVPRMETVLSKHIDRWCERTAAEGATVKAADECKTMTFDFIINVIIGRDLSESELASLIDTYKVWANGILAFPYINVPFTPFARALKARTELLRWLQAEVDRARAERAAGQQVPSILASLISAVDENGNRLTDSEVGDNLLLLLLAGHDTSAITLTNVLAQLHNSPAAMQQLRQEQQAVVARHGQALSGAVLKEMDYADAVIRETLRLLPVVPSLSRQATKDFDLGGYAVKEGEYVVSAFSHMSINDPRWVNDAPQQFKPERMLTPAGQKPGWQMPFGYGPRFCAGYAVAMAEMKAFLALLAREYEFTADTNTEWKQAIGRVPVNGLPMRVSRRKA